MSLLNSGYQVSMDVLMVSCSYLQYSTQSDRDDVNRKSGCRDDVNEGYSNFTVKLYALYKWND